MGWPSHIYNMPGRNNHPSYLISPINLGKIFIPIIIVFVTNKIPHDVQLLVNYHDPKKAQ